MDTVSGTVTQFPVTSMVSWKRRHIRTKLRETPNRFVDEHDASGRRLAGRITTQSKWASSGADTDHTRYVYFVGYAAMYMYKSKFFGGDGNHSC